MLEKDIVKAIMKYLKTVPRCFAWKEHGGMYGTAGIPDIIACVDGRFYAFEVKTETGKIHPVRGSHKYLWLARQAPYHRRCYYFSVCADVAAVPKEC